MCKKKLNLQSLGESPSRLHFGNISGGKFYIMGYPRGEELLYKPGEIVSGSSTCEAREFNIGAEMVLLT